MSVMVLFWMCLITLIITSQHVHSKVITINTTGGSDNTTCCVDGECDCSSLSTALTDITNNTVINITSQSVTLDTTTEMGSNDLNNITISGNGATIMCSNSGGVYCESCDNVVIEGITWDKCGSPGIVPAGLTIDRNSNISLINCSFQYSQIRAVALQNVLGYVIVEYCNFLSNSKNDSLYDVGGLSILKSSNVSNFINVIIHETNFKGNGDFTNEANFIGYGLRVYDDNDASASWNITISKSNFSSNVQPTNVHLKKGETVSFTLTEVYVHKNIGSQTVFFISLGNQQEMTNFTLLVLSSYFSNNSCTSLTLYGGTGYSVDIIIKDSIISGNHISYYPVVDIMSSGTCCLLSLDSVQISNNAVVKDTRTSLDHTSGVFLSKLQCDDTKIDIVEINVHHNLYEYDDGSVVYIVSNVADISVTESSFTNNTSILGSVIYFDFQPQSSDYVTFYYTNITRCLFEFNLADHSNVRVDGQGIPELPVNVYLNQSNFLNNFGACLFLTKSNLSISGDVLFVNNTADSGPALYLDMMTFVSIEDGVNLMFVNNSAVSHGGAIYAELNHDCAQNYSIFSSEGTAEVSFINNIAENGANAIYFSIFKYCYLFVNSSDPRSIMNVPYQFNYSQTINGTLTHIPTDYNYTWLNVSQFPVITSPHQLKLYGDGIHLNNNNNYFICNKVLGRPVTFRGVVLDYFDKPAEVTQFHLTCSTCLTWLVVNTFLLIDNSSPLDVILVGDEDTDRSINVTLSFHSTVNFYHTPIEVTLTIEIVPCTDHSGYYYHDKTKGCVCYHHDVNCYEDYNEIKRGYWFGSVNGQATTSLCPNQYCQFDHNRKKTRDGYYMLPKNGIEQCEFHRSGIGCGECSPGYTLAYDSTDCISVDNCSAGITVLVVVLTCLYWVVIVAVTFILVACLKFRISSGYVYGIIYYYSMVGMLLSDNPYISDKALVFINILSGFAELTPRFLGELCLVKGLSGIDQLFIHYIHAVAISLFLIAFVMVVNFSRKISVLSVIARNIIPVISLLLLLSYTSLTSTSLQLLRPLTFSDIDEVYTYLSPDIKYFTGRHVAYGIVAVICELVIGIGLPVILIMEPLLRRKFNLVTFKAFLDEFRNCYKDKYRWFAANYLICRQLILLIVFVNDSTMVFSLQVLCLVIATIHMWVRPYKKKLMNVFDGLILQLMVAVVTIGTSDSLQSVMTEASIILVVLPLLVFCVAVIIKKFVKWRRRRGYVELDDEHESEDDYPIRNNRSCEVDKVDYSRFQESLFELSVENN